MEIAKQAASFGNIQEFNFFVLFCFVVVADKHSLPLSLNQRKNTVEVAQQAS